MHRPPLRYIVRKRLLEIQEQAERLIETAEKALKEIADTERVRIQKWRCTRCGYVAWFTRPVAVEACGACAKCEGIRFVPAGADDGPPEGP